MCLTNYAGKTKIQIEYTRHSSHIINFRLDPSLPAYTNSKYLFSPVRAAATIAIILQLKSR